MTCLLCLIHLSVKSDDWRSGFPFESGGGICGLEELQVAPDHLGGTDPATEAGRQRLPLFVCSGEGIDEREDAGGAPDCGRT